MFTLQTCLCLRDKYRSTSLGVALWKNEQHAFARCIWSSNGGLKYENT